jgi:hypothetical protein
LRAVRSPTGIDIGWFGPLLTQMPNSRSIAVGSQSKENKA